MTAGFLLLPAALCRGVSPPPYFLLGVRAFTSAPAFNRANMTERLL